MPTVYADNNGRIVDVARGTVAQLNGRVPRGSVIWTGGSVPNWAKDYTAFLPRDGHLYGASTGPDDGPTIPHLFRQIARLMGQICEHPDVDRALDNSLTGEPPFGVSLDQHADEYRAYADRIEAELAKPRWDGKPDDPGVNGWHWIIPGGGPENAWPVYWDMIDGWRWGTAKIDGMLSPEHYIAAGSWTYGGPCKFTPPQP